MPLLSLRDVHHTYSGPGPTVAALRGITLDIEAGEFVAVVGPSGSGKTTLLNIIGTLEKPSRGRFLFDGLDVAETADKSLADLRARRIGFVFQNFNLIDSLTVYENIRLGLRYRRGDRKGQRERVYAAMDRVGIGHRADHLPRQLSGGQQQRCAIARAIVGDPSVVLADEPTGNLDSANAAQIINILQELNAGGTTLVVVTHAPRQADQASRILEMHDGRIRISSRRFS